MRVHSLLLLSVSLVFIFAALLFAAEPPPTFTGSDIALVELATPIRVGDVEYCRAYLVRLHGSLPAPGARLLRLYLGADPIGEYGDFPGGLYFYIPEKSRLAEVSGRSFLWKWDDGPLQDTGIRLDASAVDSLAPISEKEALSR